jgi:hypothetical protein
MAHHTTELFVQCVYSLELSYQDLMEIEAGLKPALAVIFEEHGGEFLHFEGISDTLRSQCMFSSYSEDLFHSLCDRLAPLMDGRVECRLLFVSKDLDTLHIYTVSRGAWRESCLHLPAAGPLTVALRDQDPPASA